jgi:hypothetical protein
MRPEDGSVASYFEYGIVDGAEEAEVYVVAISFLL